MSCSYTFSPKSQYILSDGAKELLLMAQKLKRSGRQIDDRQAQILVRVQRTLVLKKKLGLV